MNSGIRGRHEPFSYVVQTYVLALLTHDGVGQLAYENAVHKVHFYTFLSVGW